MKVDSFLIPENITGHYIGMREVMCCAKVWAKKLEICTYLKKFKVLTFMVTCSTECSICKNA